MLYDVFLAQESGQNKGFGRIIVDLDLENSPCAYPRSPIVCLFVCLAYSIIYIVNMCVCVHILCTFKNCVHIHIFIYWTRYLM